MAENEKELSGAIKVDASEAVSGSAQAVKAFEGVEAAGAKMARSLGAIADAQGRLRDETGRFVEGAGRAEKATTGLSGAAEGLGIDLSKLTKNLTPAGLAMGGLSVAAEAASLALDLVVTSAKVAAAGIVALTAAGAGAVAVYAQFESAFARVTTIMDEGQGNAGVMADQVRDLAVSLGVDAVEAAKGLADVIGSGIDREQALPFLATSAKLAKAGFAELGVTVKALAGIVSAYGLDASQADHVSDVLFETVKRGVTTVNELASSFSRVAPIAASAGVSLEETSAAIAALTVRGFSTEEAVTGIRAALGAILKPAEESAAALEEMGVTALALREVGLEETLLRLGRATGGAADETLRLLSDLKAANAAAALSVTGFGEFVVSADATEQALAKVNATLTSGTAVAFETVADIVRTTGEILAPFAAEFITVFADFASATRDEFLALRDIIQSTTSDWLASVREFFDEVDGRGGAITAVLDLIANGLDAVADVVTEFNPEVRMFVETMFDLMDIGQAVADVVFSDFNPAWVAVKLTFSAIIEGMGLLLDLFRGLIGLLHDAGEALGIFEDNGRRTADVMAKLTAGSREAADGFRDYSRSVDEGAQALDRKRTASDAAAESERRHRAEESKRAQERRKEEELGRAQRKKIEDETARAQEEERKAAEKAAKAAEEAVEREFRENLEVTKQRNAAIDAIQREADADYKAAKATEAKAAADRRATSASRERTEALTKQLPLVRAVSDFDRRYEENLRMFEEQERGGRRRGNDAGASLFGINGPSFGITSRPSGGSSLLGFERGGRIPEDGPINAHRAEFFLPEPAATALGPAVLETLRGLKGTTNVTIHGPQITIHQAGRAQDSRETARALLPEIVRAQRLGLAQAGVVF